MKNSLRKIKIPLEAVQGEIITVKTMAEHEMETGVRRNPKTGIIYPRLIIQKVNAKFNGKIVFSADWFSGVSANPFMSFNLKAKESGLIEIEWIDDYARKTKIIRVLKVLDKYGQEILPLNSSLLNSKK